MSPDGISLFSITWQLYKISPRRQLHVYSRPTQVMSIKLL